MSNKKHWFKFDLSKMQKRFNNNVVNKRNNEALINKNLKLFTLFYITLPMSAQFECSWFKLFIFKLLRYTAPVMNIEYFIIGIKAKICNMIEMSLSLEICSYWLHHVRNLMFCNLNFSWWITKRQTCFCLQRAHDFVPSVRC